MSLDSKPNKEAPLLVLLISSSINENLFQHHLTSLQETRTLFVLSLYSSYFGMYQHPNNNQQLHALN